MSLEKNNVFISSNHKSCIEGGLMNFNYNRNLASKIILAFFPSLVAIVLQHNHLVEPGVEGRKVTSHTTPFTLMPWPFVKELVIFLEPRFVTPPHIREILHFRDGLG